MNELLEEWKHELIKVYKVVIADSVEEERAVEELAQKYQPLLDAAHEVAEAAFDKFKKEQS